MLKRLLVVALGLMLVAAIGAFVVWSELTARLAEPYQGYAEAGVFVEVEPGDSTRVIGERLVRAGVVVDVWTFRLAVWRSGRDRSLQAGEYYFDAPLSPADTVLTIAAGDVYLRSITFPEGLTIEQTVARLLREMPLFDEDELRAALISDRLAWEYYPASLPFQLVEGLLFPDTYQLDGATVGDELGLLVRMHQQFLKVVDDLDLEARAAALGLTPYEAVILASLIEEEALLDVDRLRISRVIHNRLASGWRLGIDASTRYAVGKTAGEPMDEADLNTVSMWNTRVIVGLPPTPIAAPGRASLEAAVAPEPGRWMYYVRTDQGGVMGAHTFAVTAAEFEVARRVCMQKDLGCG